MLFAKKSLWIIDGDIYAYNIDYSVLDHILASSNVVNILAVNTELYSNTGR
jgi:pyruvate-ferredoxin/flavodoxin oxidoreductase